MQYLGNQCCGNKNEAFIAYFRTIHYLCSIAPEIFLAASGIYSDCK